MRIYLRNILIQAYRKQCLQKAALRSYACFLRVPCQNAYVNANYPMSGNFSENFLGYEIIVCNHKKYQANQSGSFTLSTGARRLSSGGIRPDVSCLSAYVC